jgi:hypothetical protein
VRGYHVHCILNTERHSFSLVLLCAPLFPCLLSADKRRSLVIGHWSSSSHLLRNDRTAHTSQSHVSPARKTLLSSFFGLGFWIVLCSLFVRGTQANRPWRGKEQINLVLAFLLEATPTPLAILRFFKNQFRDKSSNSAMHCTLFVHIIILEICFSPFFFCCKGQTIHLGTKEGF